MLRRPLSDGNQEQAAIVHFRELISVWRGYFTEDNWPTSAAHLHELLHRALIQEGANPDWIAFTVSRAISVDARNAEGKPEPHRD